MEKEEEQITTSGPTNDFPKKSLKQALSVAEALEKANAGKPLPPAETADAMGRSRGSSALDTWFAASARYGLTKGTRAASRIVMQRLGERITAPTTPDDRPAALLEAALRPSVFTALFEHYKGKKVPETQYMVNTAVREFSLDQAAATACIEIFVANSEFVSLIDETKNGRWFRAEAAVGEISITREDPTDEYEDPAADGIGAGAAEVNGAPPTPERPKRLPSALFVGARKGKARDQLTKLLTEYKIPFKVAEEEANQGRPIPTKVRQTMDDCGAAILVFTADEEYFDANGDSVWKPSDNVVHELGAAGMAYDDRIIVFKEGRVQLASNFESIGYIEFEEGKLEAKVNELLRELISLNILTLAVNA
jgi:hypothetical protein